MTLTVLWGSKCFGRHFNHTDILACLLLIAEHPLTLRVDGNQIVLQSMRSIVKQMKFKLVLISHSLSLCLCRAVVNIQYKKNLSEVNDKAKVSGFHACLEIKRLMSLIVLCVCSFPLSRHEVSWHWKQRVDEPRTRCIWLWLHWSSGWRWGWWRLQSVSTR